MKKKKEEMKKKEDELSKMGYDEASLENLEEVSGGLSGGECADGECTYVCISCVSGRKNGG